MGGRAGPQPGFYRSRRSERKTRKRKKKTKRDGLKMKITTRDRNDPVNLFFSPFLIVIFFFFFCFNVELL